MSSQRRKREKYWIRHHGHLPPPLLDGLVNFKCPYCGVVAQRPSQISGRSPKTCGRQDCVQHHKRALRKSTNGSRRRLYMQRYRERHPENYCPLKCGCGNDRDTNSRLCKMCREQRDAVVVRHCKYCECALPNHRRIVCGNTQCQSQYSKDRNALQTKRRQARPDRRVISALRCSIYRALVHDSKTDRTFNMLGYSIEDLIRHLSNHFSFGMTWDNYGEWQIDHVKPVSYFKIKRWGDAPMRMCWDLKNLKPRWKTTAIANQYGGFMEGNIEKKDRYVG